MTALTLELAGHRYRFGGMVPEQLEAVRGHFGELVTPDDREPDVRIDVHYTPRADGFMRRPPGPVEYRVALAPRDSNIELAGIGFTANVDRAPLRAQMLTCLTDAWFLGGFENLFRVLASYRVFLSGGLVLHSAAFADGPCGFLFCGRSGAGKTTICGLAAELELEILSDELNALVPDDLGFSLLAMPFAGDFGGRPQRGRTYPLTGLLGLEHSDTPRVRDCSKAEAVSRIVASCPYVNVDPLLADELTTRASELVTRAPFRILGFAKNTRFWSVLKDEYRSFDRTLSA